MPSAPSPSAGGRNVDGRDPPLALSPEPPPSGPVAEHAPAEPPRSLPRGAPARQVLLLALPMLGEQIGNFTIGLVDTFLAGKISKTATAAVGTASYMGWFIGLAFTLVGVGAAAVVSRAFGARDPRTANHALNQALVIALGLGVLLSLGAFFGAPLAANALMSTPESAELCRRFLRIDAFGYTLASLTMIGGGVLRAAGNMRTPMLVMIFVNLINALVSAGLVFGWYGPAFEGQVTGIAVGTLIARCAGGLLTVGVLWRGVRELRLRRALLRPNRTMIGRMLRIGLPAAADSTLLWISQICFISIIAHTAVGDAGTANYAAHMIAMRVEAISYLPAFAWGTAAATLVGQYLGAKQFDKAARSGHVAAMQAAGVTSAMGLCFFLFADVIFGWMTADPAVRAVGAPAFRLMAFAQPFLGAGIVYISALRGAGDTRWPMLFALLCGLGVRVPGAYIGGILLGGGLVGAWCGMWADNLVRSVLSWTRYVHGGWKKVRV